MRSKIIDRQPERDGGQRKEFEALVNCHIYIKPAPPQFNGKAERSHRVDFEDFHQLVEVHAIDVVNVFNYKLQGWEDYYIYD